MKKKKSLGSYLVEFLMLFLAITLGFFAENIREGIAENNKAKELAVGLIKDLEQDTIMLNTTIAFYRHKEVYTDSLLKLLKKPFSEIDQRPYYRLLQRSIDYSVYAPTGGSATQLKTSGYLNALDDPKLFVLLTKYDNLVSAYKSNFEREMRTSFEHQMQLQNQIADPELYDLFWLNEGTSEIPSSKGITILSKDKLVELRNNIVVTREFAEAYVDALSDIKGVALETIKHLNANYKS